MKLDSAVFYTNDIEKITEFYLSLGLKLDYHQGDKFVSFLFSNNLRLGIKLAVEDREKPGAQTIFIAEDNIGEKYNEMKSMNAAFYKELTHESWGTHFAILDPDGNKIEFIERT